MKQLLRKAEIFNDRLNACLPIYSKKREIMDCLKKNRIIIIEGKPGCGKSTQIPQYILEETDDQFKNKAIFMALPRKVAA